MSKQGLNDENERAEYTLEEKVAVHESSTVLQVHPTLYYRMLISQDSPSAIAECGE